MKITTVGLDLAKNVFQVHGVDERGRATLRKQLRREQVPLQEQFSSTNPSQEGVQDQEVIHNLSPRGSNTGGSILDGNGGSGLHGNQQRGSP